MQGGGIFKISLLSISALLAVATTPLSAAKLDSVKKYGRDYYTLDSIEEFYGFERTGAGNTRSPFKFKGPYGTMELIMNDRDARVGGHRAWLSFPLIADSKHGFLLSEIDVELLLDPVLRPEETVPRKKVVGVVLDPGHGGADRGARDSSGYSEKTAALDTAKRLKGKLEADGLNVVMTRDRDIFIPLSQRPRIANRYSDHIFVSIHYNSVHVRSANGIETFSLSPRGAPSTSAGGRTRRSDHKRHDGHQHDLHNALLMNLMHKELMTHHTRRGDRGLKRARFLVLREVKIPAVLVEGGFMSHYIDARLIRSSSYREKVAKALHRAIRSYVAIMNQPMVEDRYRLTHQPPETESVPVTPKPEEEPVAKATEKEPSEKQTEASPSKTDKKEEVKIMTEGPEILRPKPPQGPSLREPSKIGIRAETVTERLREAVNRSVREIEESSDDDPDKTEDEDASEESPDPKAPAKAEKSEQKEEATDG